MNLGDVRRLSAMNISIAAALLLWLVLLNLHDASLFEWRWPRLALDVFPLAAWMWVGVGMLLVIVTTTGLIVHGVHQAPADFARGSVRQVQCQHCKAVFFIHDTGHRPLTHLCPNCKSLGVYDGTAPPVGLPPVPKKADKVVALDLTCQACQHGFRVTDTGARPLTVTCPNCDSIGKIQ